MAVLDATGEITISVSSVVAAKVVFFDDFNRPDGTLTGSPGWSGGLFETASIENNQLSMQTDNLDPDSYFSRNFQDPDHWMQWDVGSLEGAAGAWVCCRFTNTANFLGVRNTGGSYQLCKRVGGNYIVLHTSTVPVSVGHTLKLAAVGNEWFFYIDGVLDGTGLINEDDDPVNFILPVSTNQGLLTNIRFSSEIFVDAAAPNGGDGTAENPYNKIADIPLESGMIINLARGSTWREQLGGENVSASGVTVKAYGDGPMPVLDAADVIDSGGWYQPNSELQPNAWACSVEHDVTDGMFLSLWVDGVRPVWTFPFDGTPNTWHAELSSSSGINDIVVYSTTDPNTNGVLYELSARDYGIYASDQWNIHNVRTKRPGHNNGSMILNNRSRAHGCILEDGCKHSGYQGPSSEFVDCIAWKCDYPNRDGFTAFVCFELDASGQTARFTRNVAVMSHAQYTYALANGGAMTGLYVHSDGLEGHDFDEAVFDHCSAVRCMTGISCNNVLVHRDIACHTEDCSVHVDTNADLAISTDLWMHQGSLYDVTRGFHYFNPTGVVEIDGLRAYWNRGADAVNFFSGDGEINVRSAAIRATDVDSYTYGIRQPSSDGTLNMTLSVLAMDFLQAEMGWVWGWPSDMDFNVYGGPDNLDMLINGVDYFSWPDYASAGLPYDQNTARVIDSDTLFVDPANGDFHNAPGSPAIAMGAGVQRFPDYTPIPTEIEIAAM